MTTLSDDELTELECAILDACEAARKRRWRIAPYVTRDVRHRLCCPLGALAKRAYIADVSASTGLGADRLRSFVGGFDNRCIGNIDGEMEAMGRRFRERLERGEL